MKKDDVMFGVVSENKGVGMIYNPKSMDGYASVMNVIKDSMQKNEGVCALMISTMIAFMSELNWTEQDDLLADMMSKADHIRDFISKHKEDYDC